MCYAPQFGSAKDPINLSGMVAGNVNRGDSPVLHWNIEDLTNFYILDVREPLEYQGGHIEGSNNIALGSLRERLAEIPRDRKIAIYCAGGQRSYYATRILRLNGFNAANISGGMTAFKNRVK
jgi:rhodanese-related sulfurtransferase